MQQASGHPTIENRPGLPGARWHAVRTSTRLKLCATAIIGIPRAGWRRPRVAGWLLLATGLAVFVVFFAFVLTNGDPSFRGWAVLMWLGVSLLVFAPPVIAGALLLRAG
jgi:peptidoglycan/LPS O-acetylase OafA/YrhL